MIMGIFAMRGPRKASLNRRSQLNPTNAYAGGAEDAGLTLAPEDMFRKVLSLERKRSERSCQRFVLMLVHTGKLLQAERGESIIGAITKALSMSTRETDLHGWYKKDMVVGVICTEVGSGSMNSILSALHSRVCSALRDNLNLDQMNMIHISFHVFPDDLDLENGGRPADTRLYPDLWPQDNATKTSQLLKRMIDIIGSVFALVLLSPLLIVIAAAIKLTSKGPILFKQQRLGQYGVRFTFLKFRTMFLQSDAKIHRDYVRRLISAKEDRQQADDSRGVYKIKDDPRVTRVGRFLRKTSLDELPQFFNVLRGEISLVGPRPPIPYEVEVYDIWHRRRFLEAKPGITGLWQVEGRSRVKFDEMVRLDLKYAKTWSPWLDIKILLRTPRAVLGGGGAY
jgi:lipopolysaccharide/colanic/teichoic acid biosynthesis glycosyltransferase